MPTLATTVDGLKLPNPFVIGSGPPGTNLSVINRAFQEGWGAVIAKTISLDSSKVVNVTPRYAKLHSDDGKEIIGWENIELISDRPVGIWLDEFRKCKDTNPQGVLIASIMEEYRKDAWIEIVDHNPDIALGAVDGEGLGSAGGCQGGIQPGNQPLGRGLFVAGGPIALAGQEQTADPAGFQRRS